MDYSFDNLIVRKDTDSYKWDFLPFPSGRADLIPMWVADMDFLSPPQITEALKKRAAHGVFGYTLRSESYIKSVFNWISNQYLWSIEPDWLSFCPPGVIPAIYALITLKTNPGDAIIVQEPAYGPLRDIIVKSGRSVFENPLILKEGKYSLDLEQIEQKIDSSTRMMIFCNPHNPTGRVWTRDELESLGSICLKYGIFAVSDDVHADIHYQGHPYIPLGSISPELANLTATCYSPGKTFNIGGLQTSSLVIPDLKTRKDYEQVMEMFQMRLDNLFSAAALEAGYTHGKQWLSRLMAYLEENRQYLLEFIAHNIPGIQVIKPQGTFLVWLDFRGLNLKATSLREFMLEKVGVIPSFGDEYGKTGEGFIRLNIACPKITLETALHRLEKAVKNI